MHSINRTGNFLFLRVLAFLLFFSSIQAMALPKDTLQVADLTVQINGEQDYYYAFAAGEELLLRYEPLVGNGLKSIVFGKTDSAQPLFSEYNPDSVFGQSIPIRETGIYRLRLQEKGMGKKLCRISLQKIPSREFPRFNNQVHWDPAKQSEYTIKKSSREVGKNTDVHSLGGTVTVSANKFGFKTPKNLYRFTLPKYTSRWAYRISVGQQGVESRRKDNAQLSLELKKAAAKLYGLEPTTGLAAFALGMSLEMITSKSGEDVEYALVDAVNGALFWEGKPYKSLFSQTGITVDAQRFEYLNTPFDLSFALRSDNYLDDINVVIEIEAVVETPILVEDWWLEPIEKQ